MNKDVHISVCYTTILYNSFSGTETEDTTNPAPIMDQSVVISLRRIMGLLWMLLSYPRGGQLSSQMLMMEQMKALFMKPNLCSGCLFSYSNFHSSKMPFYVVWLAQLVELWVSTQASWVQSSVFAVWDGCGCPVGKASFHLGL